jgi:hypothetical protein
VNEAASEIEATAAITVAIAVIEATEEIGEIEVIDRRELSARTRLQPQQQLRQQRLQPQPKPNNLAFLKVKRAGIQWIPALFVAKLASKSINSLAKSQE